MADQKLVKVELLVDTSTRKKGDVRELNPDRAKAWIDAGWARLVRPA